MSGGRGTSGEPTSIRRRRYIYRVPERRLSPSDDGVKLSTLKRGEAQELRVRWREVDGANGSRVAFLEVRLWAKDLDAGWFPTRVVFRFHPDELDHLADMIERAGELADAFDARGGPDAAA